MIETDTSVPAGWVTVRLGPEEVDATLVVDFVTFTSGATVTGLVAEAAEGTVLRSDPIDEIQLVGLETSLDRLADRYATHVSGLPYRLGMIVGHCSSAPLVLSIANRLEQNGHPDLSVLLLAPGFPDAAHVHEEHDAILRSLGHTDHAKHAAEDGGSMRLHVAETLNVALLAVAESAGASADEAAVLVDELGARMLAWLNYLVSATEAIHEVSPSMELRVVSPDDALATPQSGWPAQVVVSAVRVDRDELLDSEAFQQAVRDAVRTT